MVLPAKPVMVGEGMTGGDTKQDSPLDRNFFYLLNETNSQKTFYCGFPIGIKATYANQM